LGRRLGGLEGRFLGLLESENCVREAICPGWTRFLLGDNYISPSTTITLPHPEEQGRRCGIVSIPLKGKGLEVTWRRPTLR
jgi:hypothetical protein